MVLLLEGPTGAQPVELVRDEPTLAGAVVGGVREMELAGRRVLGVTEARATAMPELCDAAVRLAPRDAAVASAADLILRLRQVGVQVAEDELALLLELLAI